MKIEDKIKIVLGLYNNVLDNGEGFENGDYVPLKKAFDGITEITKIIRKA